MPSRDEILRALAAVKDPELNQDLVSLGMIKDLAIDGPQVSLTLELTSPGCPLKGQIEDDVRRAVMAVGGVNHVHVNVTSRAPGGPAAGAPSSLVPGVKNIIAVGAGKGGVGKSTVAVYLAVALARAGSRVGLLDADIYGPSIPRMMGLMDSKPDLVGGKLQPLQAHGVAVMSIGFLVDPQMALAWRGPMIHKALAQLLGEVAWGTLDYLIVDLPPGTGDVHLSLAQLVPVTGAVVVSTPQEVALQDAVKAVALYQQTGIEILGLVENMSYFVCPRCEHEVELFGRYTVGKRALQLGVPYLGELPLNLAITDSGDHGDPSALLASGEPIAKVLDHLASRVSAEIAVRLATKPAPRALSTRG
jgi:ATP-binding protein involved in chromosome partitioning